MQRLIPRHATIVYPYCSNITNISCVFEYLLSYLVKMTYVDITSFK